MCSNKSWAFLYRSGERLGGGQGQFGGLTALGRAALDEIIRLGAVVTRLWQVGFSPGDLEKIMGLNLLRGYQRVLK